MKQEGDKECLFTLSKSRGDFIIQPFKGSGAGGQHKNKKETACRIIHPASGTISECQEERYFEVNKKRAFLRLLEKPKFKQWLKVETARRMGSKLTIEEQVEREMKNTKIEVRDGNGRFIVVDEQYFLDAGKAEGLLKQLQDKIREEPYEI